MDILGLGYVGVGVRSVADWRDFATRLLGMQADESSRIDLGLRMDERGQRIFLAQDRPENQITCGWEVADGRALDAMAAKVERAGVAVKRGGPDLAARRRVKDLVCFADPAGNPVELFHGQEMASTPFEPGRAISGFRTGALGLGHAVLTVADFDAIKSFYTEVLGFRVSDYITKPFAACFLHTNQRHHSLALIGTGKAGVHHLMAETCALDDVGQAYDLAMREEGRVSVTLGRHANDLMTSFYAKTPSDFLFEYGWGGKLVDPATWKAEECLWGPDLWGHERSWLPPEGRLAAREMRIAAAAAGARAPVHVMQGQFHAAA